MSKRRDALRRGIRSLIHDTSRELADFEGRPHPADVPIAGDVPAAPPARRDSPARITPGSVAHAAPGPAAELEAADAPVDAGPGHGEAPSGPVADAGVAWIVGPDPAAPAAPAPPANSRPVAPRVDPPGAAPAPQAARPAHDSRPAKTAGSHRAARTARGTRKPARSARRAPRRSEAEGSVNGVDPRQAQSRKGVCFAYFINHECWRVPDAYCNTALQVCALRKCPVYHLHRDALERRFAGKFKHLW